MSKKTKHLAFFRIEDNSRKTLVFDVYNDHGFCLGQVRYFTRWRKYSFFPMESTVYDSGCLKEITAFIDQLMDDRFHEMGGKD